MLHRTVLLGSDGLLTQPVIQVFSGMIGLIVIAAIVVGLYTKVSDHRSKKKKDKKDDKEDSEGRIRREIKIDYLLEEMNRKQERMLDDLKDIGDSLTTRVINLEVGQKEHQCKIQETEAKASAAHKRVDRLEIIVEKKDNGMSNTD